MLGLIQAALQLGEQYQCLFPLNEATGDGAV